MAYMEYYSFIEARADKKWSELYSAFRNKSPKEIGLDFNAAKNTINFRRKQLAIQIGKACEEAGFEPLYVHWNGKVKTIDRSGKTKDWNQERIIQHIFLSRSYLYPINTQSLNITPETQRRTLTDLAPELFAEFHEQTYLLSSHPLAHIKTFTDEIRGIYEYEIARIDLFFGCIQNIPFSEQRIFKTHEIVKDCLVSCTKTLDLEVDRQLVPTREALLKLYSSLSKKTLELITTETVKAFEKRGEGTFDHAHVKSILFTFLRELRPVAVDIKNNPEAIIINNTTDASFMYSYNPKDTRQLLKDRAKVIRSAILKAKREQKTM